MLGLDLDVSLDTYDGFLLDANSVFGSGTGLPTTDDIIMYEFIGLSCDVLQEIILWLNAGGRQASST